jgi:uncharacterized protein (DUF433 family)
MAQTNTLSSLIHTDRGITLSGTRITLNDLMDYVTAGWPPKLIRDRLGLSDEQVQAAMDYIQNHRAEVEAEYRQVLQAAEENRRYWEDRNRERLDRIASTPPEQGRQAARDKLAAWKAKRSPR